MICVKALLMLTETPIAIKDACIIIDLIELQLIEAFYKLEMVVYTTEPVIAEITEEEQISMLSGYINSGALRIDSEGQFEDVGELTRQNPSLSFADGSVLEVALRRGCMVLSCDASLRRTASTNSLVVKGVLWIIEELCNEEILTIEAAVEKLELYLLVNKRAPKSEIQDLISRLKGTK